MPFVPVVSPPTFEGAHDRAHAICLIYAVSNPSRFRAAPRAGRFPEGQRPLPCQALFLARFWSLEPREICRLCFYTFPYLCFCAFALGGQRIQPGTGRSGAESGEPRPPKGETPISKTTVFKNFGSQ